MPTLSFDDFDACAATLRDWELEAVQLDRGPFRGELKQTQSATALVTEAMFSRRLHQTGEPPRGLRTVVIPADPEQRIAWRNHQVAGDQLMFFPRGCALDAVSAPGFHVFTISFPEDLASELAYALNGDEYESLLAGRELLSGPPSMVRELRRTAKRFVRTSVDLATAIGHADDISRDIGIDLLEGLIEALGQCDESPRPLPRHERELALTRSLDLIKARGRESPSISDLCRVSGVSRRTLEYGFRERFGISPKAFMMARRLEGVRRDLKRSVGKASITHAANHWGFFHMSQFAALYRRQFGELPSKTLRDARGFLARGNQ